MKIQKRLTALDFSAPPAYFIPAVACL